jgi:hypothetical protein
MLVGVARVLDHGLNVDHPGVGAVNLNVHILPGLSKKALNEPKKARTPPRWENGSTPEAVLPRKESFCSLAFRRPGQLASNEVFSSKRRFLH